LAHELVQRWAAPLCNEAEVIEVAENTAEFILGLADLRLRTMHQVPCLLVGGETDLSAPLQSFWNRFNSTHHLPFVLALSETAYQAALKILHSGRSLILSSKNVRDILLSSAPLQELKQILIRQISRRTLIPYNLLVPADGGMFFGRAHELNRLREEDFNSFAIAGPGRIGKTSLAFRYHNELRRSRDPRATRVVYANLYNCDHLPDRTARFLAMKIESSRRSDRMTTRDLLNFLLYQKKRYGGPLELILDEVDEDCESPTFRALGEAARAQLCRLILCGKGGLLKTLLSSKSPLDCRLDWIQLGPLDSGSARDLLIKPITDLGFKIEEPDKLTAEVLDLTGQLPNLVQLFGMKLVDRAIVDKTETVAIDHLEALKKDFFVAQFFIKSLNELTDPDTRLIALLLLEQGCASFSSTQIQILASREGLNLNDLRANEICLDLLVNNVLIWDNGSYRIASGGLPFYARKKDYLKTSLEKARAARQQQRRTTQLGTPLAI
jgi:hypothetical protein